jgi:hypothetical protein
MIEVAVMKEDLIFFWKWFSDNEQYIYEELENRTDAIAFSIAEQLKLVHPDIVFEISFEKENDKMNFVISADGDINLFPLVIELCGIAPYYKRWNIVPFRPRLDQKNQVIEVDGIKLDYDDVFFTYSVHGEYINLDVYIKGYDQEDNRYIHTYFILLDSLIGEFDAVTKIGITTVYSYIEDASLFNIRELINIIDFLDSKNQSLN